MKYYSYIVCFGILSFLSPNVFAQEPAHGKVAVLIKAEAVGDSKQEKAVDLKKEIEVPKKSEDKAVTPKVLKLLNGDIFPAEWKQFISKKKSLTGPSAPARLLMGSELLQGDVELDMKSLASLEMSGMSQDAAGFARIKMSNDTCLFGNLLNVSGEHIEVDTVWGGKILLKKKMVDAIELRSPSTFFCIGTDDLKGWKQYRSGADAKEVSDAWSVDNACFVSKGNAWRSLSRSAELPDKIKTELRLHYKGYSLRPVISLWNDNSSNDPGKRGEQSDNNLFLEIQGGYCSLYLGAASLSRRIPLGTCRFKVNYASSKEDILDIVFYADKKARRFILYINGLRVGNWEAGMTQDFDNSPQVEDAFKTWKGGKNIVLSVSGAPVRISHLSVSRWRGGEPAVALKSSAELAPPADAKEAKPATTGAPVDKSKEREEEKEGKSHIQLVNGDVVIGEILELGATSIRVRTADYTVNIPIHRALGLNLVGAGGTGGSIQRLYANDVRLDLGDHSDIILDLRGFDGSCLTGYSEAMGLVKIKPGCIRNIFFNINDVKQAKKNKDIGGAKGK